MTATMWIVGFLAVAGGVLVGVGLAMYQHRQTIPPLDCGCPRSSPTLVTCMRCGHTRCWEHRDDKHECKEESNA